MRLFRFSLIIGDPGDILYRIFAAPVIDENPRNDFDEFVDRIVIFPGNPALVRRGRIPVRTGPDLSLDYKINPII